MSAVRFNYTSFQQAYRPPAPLLPVTVGNPLSAADPVQWVAQLDPGADRTVIPDRLLAQLGTLPFDWTVVESFGGMRYKLPTYVVRIALPSLRTHVVEVTEGRGEDYVLLGREILNKYRLVLNGPESCLDIE